MNEQQKVRRKINKLHSYEYIFREIVVPLAEEIAKEVDPDFKIACGFEILDTTPIFNKSNVLFRQKRESLKKMFYGNVFLEKDEVLDDDNYRLDLHKIASIVCAALIRNKFFWYDEKKAQEYIRDKKCSTDWKIKNILANYRLAVHASFSVIYNKMLFDLEGKNPKLYKKIEDQQGLYLYRTNVEHESFENSIILDFAKRDIGKRSFDYLLYSTLLYQLEEYNYEKFNTK